MVHLIKSGIADHLLPKIGALLMQEVFDKLKAHINPHRFGAAPLLGISKPVFIGHGGSNAEAIVSSVGLALQSMHAQVTGHMQDEIQKYG
jgi:glycerol-3-phosphate acyltransferase PlsX